MKFSKAALLIAGLSFPLISFAAAVDTSHQAAKQKLTDVIGVEVISLKASPINGVLEAITDKGVLYISEDGSKLIHGNIYDLNDRMNNLTEAALAGPRLEMLKPIEKDMLVYKAKNEKHVVTVFTDVDCGYCRKLHAQMEDYNKLGITIRYLAYPRRGIPSQNADEMQAVWCAKDPLKAMTEAKAGGNIKAADCDIDIAKQYQLGMAFGINGTPAMILEDGTMIPGYQPPESLIKTLDSRK